MERVVGRDILKCHVGGGYDLVKRELGNGHREYLMMPIKTWEHIGVLSDQAFADRHGCMEATQEERKLANLERAAKRAKSRVRHTFARLRESIPC